MPRARIDVEHPMHAGLDQIRQSADKAAVLTRQLLAFSRRQAIQPGILDLNTVVSDMEKMLRRLIGEHIELVTRLAPDEFAEEVIRIIDSERLGVEGIHMLSGVGDTTVMDAQSRRNATVEVSADP